MKIIANIKLLLVGSVVVLGATTNIHAQSSTQEQELRETKSKYEELELKTNVREGYHGSFHAEGIIDKDKVLTQQEITQLATIDTVEGVFGNNVKVMYGFSYTDKLMFNLYIHNLLPIDIPLTNARIAMFDVDGKGWLGMNQIFGYEGSMMVLKNKWQIINVPIEKMKKHMAHRAETFKLGEIPKFKYNLDITIRDEIPLNNTPEELTDIFSNAVRMNSVRNILYYKHPQCGEDDYSKEELREAVYSPDPIPDHAVSIRDFNLPHKYKVKPEKQLVVTYFNTHKQGGQTIPIGEHGGKWYFITCRK